MTSRRSCEVGIFGRRLIDILLMPLTDDEGNESSRSLGLIVARGTLLVLISPVDGSEEIANPFQQPGEE
jgi:U6 snRNA-associated Sm-like protein LSm7